MSISFTLDDFEERLDPVILERGQQLVESAEVMSLSLREDVIDAYVNGTDVYHAELHVQGKLVVDTICTCAHDPGSVCEHVAAVLYAIHAGGPPRSVRIRPKGFPGSSEFAKVIRQAIRRARRGSGIMIEWNRIPMVTDRVAPLLADADSLLPPDGEAITEQDALNVVRIAATVMDLLTPVVSTTMDRSGRLLGCIAMARELLLRVTKAPPPEPVRRKLFAFAVKASLDARYWGWDWHQDMLWVASETARTKKELEQVVEVLDRAERNDYDRPSAQVIRYAFLRRTQGDSAAEAYLQASLDNAQLREEALRIEFERGAYDRVVQIVQDAMARDATNRPSLPTQWEEWLLKVAVALEDREAVVRHARALFMERNADREDLLPVLKANVPDPEWEAFAEEMIRELQDDSWNRMNEIAEILLLDSKMDRLLDLLREHPYLSFVDHYAPPLLEAHHKEVVDLYRMAFETRVSETIGRSAYKGTVRQLRRIQRLIGREGVDHIVEALRRRFTNRRALLEELDRM